MRAQVRLKHCAVCADVLQQSGPPIAPVNPLGPIKIVASAFFTILQRLHARAPSAFPVDTAVMRVRALQRGRGLPWC